PIPASEYAGCTHRERIPSSAQKAPPVPYRECRMPTAHNKAFTRGLALPASFTTNRWDYSMNRRQTMQILQLHKDCGIPLQHSVAMLFRVLGVSLSDTAAEAGYQRTYLYKALSGELEPSTALRHCVESVLGVDPWLVHAGEESDQGFDSTKSTARQD
ncbi:MAG: hypothetical protein ACU84J_14370, partial [Gammaproteobacteria bacterium]